MFQDGELRLRGVRVRRQESPEFASQFSLIAHSGTSIQAKPGLAGSEAFIYDIALAVVHQWQ